MRKLLLSLLFVLFILTQTIAQNDFRVKSSTIVLTNGSSPAELIIENSTKNIKGILVNRGNGQTEFRQAQRMNDSTFVIGYDTLTFRGTAQNLQQVTDAGKTTTRYINADSGYYQRGIPLLVATDSILKLGYHAGESNTTGGGNTAVGNRALQNNTTGRNNTAFGYQVLQLNTTGSGNVASGWQAMVYNTSGSGNVGLGRQALGGNTTGANNVAIGMAALGGNSTGSENTALGYLTAGFNTTGSGITAIGREALEYNTTGVYNTAVGAYSLYTNASGGRNTAVGLGAAKTTYGSDITAVGCGAVNYFSGNGGLNRSTAIGSGALSGGVGDQNTAVGAGAIGQYGGPNNTAVGDSALIAARNWTYNNTVLGKNAGANITGAYNIAIGYRAYVADANDSAQLSIGNLIYGTGVKGTDTTVSNGRIGIKTKTPAYEMDVNGKLGVRSLDSISDAVNVLCQDPATGEIKKAAFGKPQSFIQTATNVISGTNAETTIISGGTGSLVIPASAWFAGKSFRIVVRGIYSTSATNAANLIFKIKLGNTVIAQTSGIFLRHGITDIPYEIRAEFTCRSTGASGSVFAMGLIRNDGEYVSTIDNGTSAATVDLSVNQTLNITATLSDAAAGNSLSTYIVTIEAIN
ncbi:hypothetical protein A3860_25170 [Niastella vici]|uniref:Trimeric autotransporter adhesin YadA-like head domain-containing protein n=1 Tax=Niastella vici TaxID=1703345 RepID=A0A1V9FXZ4_9BACT|nr:hypothetical protein [Niastella vici]OQP63184.1 hypothetical protein A3860_25170 [Niastella vici]